MSFDEDEPVGLDSPDQNKRHNLLEIVQEYPEFSNDLDQNELENFIQIDANDSEEFIQTISVDIKEVIERFDNDKLIFVKVY